jgi:probable HAF family extracellular repeat protein
MSAAFKERSMNGIVFRTLFLFVCLASSLMAKAQVFSVTDMGTFAPTDINAFGQVAGYGVNADGHLRPFLWTKKDGVQELGTLGGPNAYAAGINDLGHAVGASDGPPYPCVGQGGLPITCYHTNAFVWTKNGGMKQLEGLAASDSSATAINNIGQVIGYFYTAGDVLPRAFLWTKSSGMRDLGMPDGVVGIDPISINNEGQIVGFVFLADPGGSGSSAIHGFMWTKHDGFSDLGTVTSGKYDQSYALAINDLGRVVGELNASATNFSEGFLWTRKGGMQEVPMPSGAAFGTLRDINIFGVAVGSFCTQPCSSEESWHAAVWTKATGLQDLNSLIPRDSGWILESANFGAINGWSQIVGVGRRSGEYRAFLLTPVWK